MILPALESINLTTSSVHVLVLCYSNYTPLTPYLRLNRRRDAPRVSQMIVLWYQVYNEVKICQSHYSKVRPQAIRGEKCPGYDLAWGWGTLVIATLSMYGCIYALDPCLPFHLSSQIEDGEIVNLTDGAEGKYTPIG